MCFYCTGDGCRYRCVGLSHVRGKDGVRGRLEEEEVRKIAGALLTWFASVIQWLSSGIVRYGEIIAL